MGRPILIRLVRSYKFLIQVDLHKYIDGHLHAYIMYLTQFFQNFQ